MEQAANIRKYVILQDLDPGFGMQRPPEGFARLDANKEGMTLSLQVKNLREGAFPYTVILVYGQNGEMRVIRAGNLEITSQSGFFSRKLDADATEKMNLQPGNILYVLIAAEHPEKTNIPMVGICNKACPWNEAIRQRLRKDFLGAAAEAKALPKEKSDPGSSNAGLSAPINNPIFTQPQRGTGKNIYAYHPEGTDKDIYAYHPERTEKDIYAYHPKGTGKDIYANHPEEMCEDTFTQTPEEMGEDTFTQTPEETGKDTFTQTSEETGKDTFTQTLKEMREDTQTSEETDKDIFTQQSAEKGKKPYTQSNPGSAAENSTGIKPQTEDLSEILKQLLSEFRKTERKTGVQAENPENSEKTPVIKQSAFEKPKVDDARLERKLKDHFEAMEPFSNPRHDYSWYRVNDLARLSNLLFSCNIRIPLFANPRILVGLFKYRHLLAGFYRSDRNNMKYFVLGVPSRDDSEGRPFERISRWVEVQNPDYGDMTGYWLVYINLQNGEFVR